MSGKQPTKQNRTQKGRNNASRKVNKTLTMHDLCCNRCGKTYTANLKASLRQIAHLTLCPACRKVSKPMPVQQNLDRIAKTATSSRMQSKLSAVASTSSRALVPAKPGTSRGVPAKSRLLLSQMDCRATMGQQPIKFDMDQSSVPTIGYQYDTNFTFSLADTNVDANVEVLLQWLASPVVACRLISDQLLVVRGTQSYAVQLPEGKYSTYVFGNKIGYLGELTDEMVLKYSTDWTSYRVVSCSGALQWCGKQIDKNGVTYTSRITEKDDLSDFQPQANADMVVANVDNVITVSCVHNKPVYNWKPIDANDEVAENSNGKTPAEYQFNYQYDTTYRSRPGSVGNMEGVYSNVQIGDASGELPAFVTAFKAALIYSTEVMPSRGSAKLLAWLQSVNSKYDGSILSASGPDHTVLKAVTAVTIRFRDVAIGANVSSTYRNWLNSLKSTEFEVIVDPTWNSLSFTTSADLMDKLLTVWMDSFSNNYGESGVTGDYGAIFDLDVSYHIKFNSESNRTTNTKAKIPAPLAPQFDLGAQNLTPYDDDFRFPVTQIVASRPFFQVYQQVITELQVQDGSAFTELAVAASKSNRAAYVKTEEVKRFSRIMDGMPPALIMSDNGVDQLTVSQLASRGILADIAGMLGGVVTSILPGTEPIIGFATGALQALNL